MFLCNDSRDLLDFVIPANFLVWFLSSNDDSDQVQFTESLDLRSQLHIPIIC